MEESLLLQLLPDEKLQEICENLDDKSLGRLVRASHRLKSACQEIIDRKKTLYKTKCDTASKFLESLPYFSIILNDRTTLRLSLEKGESPGYGYIDQMGRIRGFLIYRTDIIIIQLQLSPTGDSYNIFIEPDLRYTSSGWNINDPKLFEQIEPYLEDYINYCLSFKHSNFIKLQQKWFTERPWEKISGKTPQEAIQILKELGW